MARSFACCRTCQMQFDEYLCHIMHGFNSHGASRGPSAIAELLAMTHARLLAACLRVRKTKNRSIVQLRVNTWCSKINYAVMSYTCSPFEAERRQTRQKCWKSWLTLHIRRRYLSDRVSRHKRWWWQLQTLQTLNHNPFRKTSAYYLFTSTSTAFPEIK